MFGQQPNYGQPPPASYDGNNRSPQNTAQRVPGVSYPPPPSSSGGFNTPPSSYSPQNSGNYPPPSTSGGFAPPSNTFGAPPSNSGFAPPPTSKFGPSPTNPPPPSNTFGAPPSSSGGFTPNTPPLGTYSPPNTGNYPPPSISGSFAPPPTGKFGPSPTNPPPPSNTFGAPPSSYPPQNSGSYSPQNAGTYSPPPSSSGGFAPPSNTFGAPPPSRGFASPPANAGYPPNNFQPTNPPPPSNTFGAPPSSYPPQNPGNFPPNTVGYPPNNFQPTNPPPPSNTFGAPPLSNPGRFVPQTPQNQGNYPPNRNNNYNNPNDLPNAMQNLSTNPDFAQRTTQQPQQPQPLTNNAPNFQTPAPRIDLSQVPTPTSGELRAVRFRSIVGSPPPSAASQFVCVDEGNCTPRFIRSTLYTIPTTEDLLSTSHLPMALCIQPLAEIGVGEDPVPVVDLTHMSGLNGPVRCNRCRAYINPFVKFVDGGRKYICKLCDFENDLPDSYFSPLEPNGRRHDIDRRPELTRGSVDFVVNTPEYMQRVPKPPHYLFLIDVSEYSITSGMFQSLMESIRIILTESVKGEKNMGRFAFVTFDTTIHFWNLRKANNGQSQPQPQMMVVPDLENIFVPLSAESFFLNYEESQEAVDSLLEKLPTMFHTQSGKPRPSNSALGAALLAASAALENIGGRVLVFQACLPSYGPWGLKPRDDIVKLLDSEKEKSLYLARNPFYRTVANELAGKMICVDLFVFAHAFIDLTTLSIVPTITGGQVYYYPTFSLERGDADRLRFDLKRHLTRPHGYDAVMRVRSSRGLVPYEYIGNFASPNNADLEMAGVDCDKAIVVMLKHDDKLEDKSEPTIQAAMLYTTVEGQRRIRVHTISFTASSILTAVFKAADIDTIISVYARQAVREIPNHHISSIKNQVIEKCVDVLAAYRKYCANVTGSSQLILPEALKLLPIYILALTKNILLRQSIGSSSTPTTGDATMSVDERIYTMALFNSVPSQIAVPLIYPKVYALHKLTRDAGYDQNTGQVVLPPTLRLSNEVLESDGIYLIENGQSMFLWLGKSVPTSTLNQLFGTQVQTLSELTRGFTQQYPNDLSRQTHELVSGIMRLRGRNTSVQIVRQKDPLEARLFGLLVEDRGADSMSYVDFLCHIHRLIQNKLSDY